MDMRIIEVAIGLTLVFAIASLVVSTLNEIWTSARKSRGDNLFLGLCSVLGEDNVTMGRMRRRFMPARRPSKFALELLAHPLLQSQVLGAPGTGRYPSYLPADVFVAGLIAHLSRLYAQDARPDTPQALIGAIKAGRTDLPPEHQPTQVLVRTLATLAEGTPQDWSAYEVRLCAWYDSVMERAGGWYRRDTQLRLLVIGFLVAAAVNINPFVIGPRLWQDPVLRAAVTGVAAEASKAYVAAASPPAASPPASPESSPVPAWAAPLLRAAAAVDVARPAPRVTAASTQAAPPPAPTLPQSLEVDRALDSLKRSLFDAAAATRAHPMLGNSQVDDALGLLLDLEDQVRARRRAVGLTDDPMRVFDASVVIERHVDGLDERLSAVSAGAHEPPKRKLARLRDALQGERDALLPASAGASRAGRERVCQRIEDEAERVLCSRLEGIQALAGIGLPVGWSWSNWPRCDGACQERHQRGAPGAGRGAEDPYAAALAASPPASAARLKAVYHQARRSVAEAAAAPPWPGLFHPDVRAGLWEALAGWLLIAIAATLGAPFWFDLLSRFVKVRGTGAGGSGTDGKPPGPGSVSGPTGGVLTPPTPPSGAPPPTAPADNGAVNATERSLGTAQIVRLQNALGIGGPEASGRFDGPTRRKLAEWQRANGMDDSGELTPRQLELLLPPAPPPQPAPSPVPPGQRTRTPRRADGTVNVLTEAEVRALYGNIGTVPDTDPNFVKVVTPGLPGQAQWELAEFRHPVLAPFGETWRVHAKALRHFQAVFDAIAQAGLQAHVRSCGGTFCARHIGHDIEKPLSRHSWGIAIDLNAAENPYGKPPAPRGAPGSLVELVPIFERFGFAWGGHFRTTPDGMHFELALRDPEGPLEA